MTTIVMVLVSDPAQVIANIVVLVTVKATVQATVKVAVKLVVADHVQTHPWAPLLKDQPIIHQVTAVFQDVPIAQEVAKIVAARGAVQHVMINAKTDAKRPVKELVLMVVKEHVILDAKRHVNRDVKELAEAIVKVVVFGNALIHVKIIVRVLVGLLVTITVQKTAEGVVVIWHSIKLLNFKKYMSIRL